MSPPESASPDPLALFRGWFDDAVAAGVAEPEIMALATATPDGQPSVRYVLYRGVSGDGIRFFTNLESRKGEELAAQPAGGRGLLLERARPAPPDPAGGADRAAVAGARTTPTSPPARAGHRLAAWASPQSRPIAHTELLARYAELEHDPRRGGRCRGPPTGAASGCVPDVVERWIAQDNRLHLRTRYRRADD